MASRIPAGDSCGALFFYPVLLLLPVGERIFFNVSAAASSADLMAWAYIFVVVDALACPRRFATVVSGTPPAICKVALVWRRL